MMGTMLFLIPLVINLANMGFAFSYNVIIFKMRLPKSRMTSEVWIELWDSSLRSELQESGVVQRWFVIFETNQRIQRR